MTDGSVTQLPVEGVQALLDTGAALIDVREHQETVAGRAAVAQCVPLQAFTLDSVPEGVPIVLICRSGYRSNVAAAALADLGYTTYNVIGGMQAWQQAGLPIVTDSGEPGIVL